MVETIADAAKEVSSRYSQYKNKLRKDPNKKNKNIFIGILEDVYNKYGRKLGYSDLSDFKSIIVQYMNLLKKRRKIGSNIPDSEEVEFWHESQRKPAYHPKEGDGEIFTQDQVRCFDLNSESY